MEFLHTAIALLASAVFILAGMIGYLYWQQVRLHQTMHGVVGVMGDVVRATHSKVVALPVEEAPAAKIELVDSDDTLSVEDDRVSVEDEPVIVSGPPALDTDGLEEKTAKELKDILTERGIPFGKRDPKPALLSLLKATI